MSKNDWLLQHCPDAADKRRSDPEVDSLPEYEEGTEAHKNNKSWKDNPYVEDSIQHLAWYSGWKKEFDYDEYLIMTNT